MRSGTQPTQYHIELMVLNSWSRTKHSFAARKAAQEAFAAVQTRDPRGWYRLVSETILETVTP